MLYNLSWLEPGKPFPPAGEDVRITRYLQNEMLFNGDHFADARHRTIDGPTAVDPVTLYTLCASRIEKVIGNFEDIISFPVLLNYQRMISVKTADLLCGEAPVISAKGNDKQNDDLGGLRDNTCFDEKLYATIIDLSRFGDSIWRIYINETNELDFTCWDPKEWYPIVKQDGTHRITDHVLCWRENKGIDYRHPDWYLHVQIHNVANPGSYAYRVFKMDSTGLTIGNEVSNETVQTGIPTCCVMSLRPFATSTTVYGYDDYMPIDSILAEIIERIGQISVILDKHADPNIAGPVSMLSRNEKTGEYYLKTGSFFAVAPGDNMPQYMTWEGQLDAAFKQLELLINQLYVISEMGAALLGGKDGGSQAISGTAMRFKMVSPLAKVRRLTNSLTMPVRKLFSTLSGGNIKVADIGIEWFDGLPDDPRENIEMAKLVTGEKKLMPLKVAIREYFSRTDSEAEKWLEEVREETEAAQALIGPEDPNEDPNKPGPQDGTGINTQKKGSTTGLKNFHGLNN